MATTPDPEALLVALVIAPGTYSRNKFFELYENADLRHARRRAQLVRSVIKDLTEPWPYPGSIPPHPKPVIVEERKQSDGLHLTYEIANFGYRRSTILSSVETAALRYALHRAGVCDLDPSEKALVEESLNKLAQS